MKFLLIIYSLLLPCILFAQKHKPITVVAKVHYGSIFIHTPIVKNVKGSNPYGTELEFSRQPVDSFSVGKCNCFPRNGIALTYFNFDTKILGHGVMLSYFIEPSYKINKKLQFNLRGAAGLTYVSNPYDAVKNPENKNYTTHLNPFLQVGVGLGYNVNTNLRTLIMTNFQHFSNGAFKLPNRGLNWVTGSLGLLYTPQTTVLPDNPRLQSKLFIDKKFMLKQEFCLYQNKGITAK